ncbi:Fur family transcriptional regulator [uncultured Pseudokineococcus sp.]|uniref:Fur family transcriptional regulator n=1 Tax=uncultured Pseudokineococcus sp. TaxID=1642928 RepID=UPI0026230597|nr:Fur family transcriptional regulator [uncultured Pseudokineococcus sp.]
MDEQDGGVPVEEVARERSASALELLRHRGGRVTTARRAVVAVLAGTDAHLSADDVAARVEASAPGVHRATVYRTLESLAGLGVVEHVHLDRGPVVHHLAAGPERAHLHARCQRCGRVEDVPGDLLDDAGARLAREVGFALDPGHVALSGTCRACAAA